MSNVIILTDSHGHLYIVGQDTLDRTRVRTGEHIDLINDLLQRHNGDNPELKILGTYPVAEDRFLNAVKLQPDFVVLGGNHSMPA